MRFASLGSGSRGNATVVQCGSTCVLVDCGFSRRETGRRLQRLGLDAQGLDAILVTHEHSDHASGVGSLAASLQIPVYLTPGTHLALDLSGVSCVEHFNCHQAFRIRDLEICPFPVPHDARENSQFRFSDGDRSFAILTDTGHLTNHVVAMLSSCEALLVEANHDPDMLAAGPYPPALKDRVAGGYGHLSNTQTTDLLTRIDPSRLHQVVAAHVSDKNNTQALALQAVASGLGCEEQWIGVADQMEGLDWRDV